MQQADGNLVLYRQGNQIQKQWNPAGWSSGKKGGGAYVRILEDGRLVMWRGTSWVWEWGTSGAWSLNTRLVLGPDGSLKIYQDNDYAPILQRLDECRYGERTWAHHPTCGPNESSYSRDFTGSVTELCGEAANYTARQQGLKLCYATPEDRR
jgi:hypothetical protein